MNLLPALDQPVTVMLPDGRRAVLRLELLDDSPLVVVAPVIRLPLPVLRQPLPVPAPALPTLPPPPRIAPGRFTAFLLCYGDYTDMHRRCLDGFLSTVPVEECSLRVYCNQTHPRTRTYVDQLHQAGRVERVYHSLENVKKYPAMRQMFHDLEAPIQTPWLLWLDDDTMCDVDPGWWAKMKQALDLAAAQDPALGMMGAKYYSHLGKTPERLRWIREANWYKGRALQNRDGREIPNGDAVHFCTGSFWVMKTECVKRCDLPDVRLQHNGGDIAIGAAIYQNGYGLKHWNGNKKIVLWSAKPRRGLHEPIFGV